MIAKREAFRVSKNLEYLSEPELTKQTGYTRAVWTLALIKELVDNSLDACEEHRILPEITITVGDDFVSVADNGPGIIAESVAGMADVGGDRISSREAYRCPTRGKMGNAGKCLIGIPHVMDRDNAKVTIE
ncbi:MAG: hypothetical protein WBD31_22160, partial [Rubripirellula sp.]